MNDRIPFTSDVAASSSAGLTWSAREAPEVIPVAQRRLRAAGSDRPTS